MSETEKDKGSTSHKKDRLAEYVIDRILKGDVFFLGEEYLVEIQERESSIKFERTGISVKLRKYDKETKLFFIKKNDRLKNYSSDIWKPIGANWETLFGFYFDNEMPIRAHVYYIGREFDSDKLSEMVYSLFSDSKDCIKISNIAFKYGDDTKVNKEFENTFIQDILDKEKLSNEKLEKEKNDT